MLIIEIAEERRWVWVHFKVFFADTGALKPRSVGVWVRQHCGWVLIFYIFKDGRLYACETMYVFMRRDKEMNSIRCLTKKKRIL